MIPRRAFVAGLAPAIGGLGMGDRGDPPSMGGGIRDVRQYGAVGDGYADDSPAIQRALDDGHGGTVFFPQGTYRIDAPLTPRTETVMLAYGQHTTLTSTTPGEAIIVARKVARLWIEGIHIWSRTTGPRHGIIFDSCDDIRVFRSWVRGAVGHGIIIQRTGPTITDTSIELNTQSGVFVSDCNSGLPLQMLGCFMYGNTLHGLQFQGNANESMIVGCQIIQNKGTGVHIDEHSEMISVTSNVIQHNDGIGVHIRRSRMTALVSNLILESGSYGVLVEDGSHGTVVMANRCVSNGRDDRARYAAVAVRGSHDVMVMGNALLGLSTTDARQLDADATSVVITSGNVLHASGET